jgi:hypothetical protein
MRERCRNSALGSKVRDSDVKVPIASPVLDMSGLLLGYPRGV